MSKPCLSMGISAWICRPKVLPYRAGLSIWQKWMMLYQNHQKHQQEFFKHHAVDESNFMQVFDILQHELDNWKESDEDAEEHLLRIIAVYCGFYERLHATWHWHEEFEMVELLIPRKRNGVARYRPIPQIYGMMREGGTKSVVV